MKSCLRTASAAVLASECSKQASIGREPDYTFIVYTFSPGACVGARCMRLYLCVYLCAYCVSVTATY